MTLHELTRMLAARKIRLEAQGRRLIVRGSRAALTPEVQQAIRENSTALLCTLTGRLVSCSDLYRYVRKGDRVLTPAGEGRVLQVFGNRVTVHVGERALFFEPEELELLQQHEAAQAADVPS